jgi:hypothetical protein
LPRPPPPTGKFLPVEIRALREVIDSLGDSKFPTEDPREQRRKTFRSGVERPDFYERTYPVLWVMARHGVVKKLAVGVTWDDLSLEKKTLKIADDDIVPLDDQDIADLKKVRSRYPNPTYHMKYMVGTSVWTHHIDPRVMERWACRADLRRVPACYADLVLGFAALDPSTFRRIAPPRSS